MECILLRVQLLWAGQVTRLEDVVMPEAVFFSELQELKHDHGTPRKRCKDQLKKHLAQTGIDRQSWQQEASDRGSWRSSVRRASRKFEAERHEAAKEKRKKQKERAASPSSSVHTFVCRKCSRVRVSRIGVYNHQQACKNGPSTFKKMSSARNQPPCRNAISKFKWLYYMILGLSRTVSRLVLIPVS